LQSASERKKRGEGERGGEKTSLLCKNRLNSTQMYFSRFLKGMLAANLSLVNESLEIGGAKKVNSLVLFCFVLFCFVLFCFVLFCFVLFPNYVDLKEE